MPTTKIRPASSSRAALLLGLSLGLLPGSFIDMGDGRAPPSPRGAR